MAETTNPLAAELSESLRLALNLNDSPVHAAALERVVKLSQKLKLAAWLIGELAQLELKLLSRSAKLPELAKNGDYIIGNGEPGRGASHADNAFQTACHFTFDQAQREAVREALKRLSVDPYSAGICQNCSQKIPVKRLELVPTTPYCVECAKKATAEKRLGNHRR